MDRIIQETSKEVNGMQVRFRERAKAITGAQMPPLEGVMRKKWIAQKEADYQDFLMIADCDVDFTEGILHLTLDLRPKICDATLREQGVTVDGEVETQVAMQNIAKALPTDGNKIKPSMLDSKSDLKDLIDGSEMFRVVEKVKPIEITDGEVLAGHNLHKQAVEKDVS